jgi:hypothetical protein
MDTRRRVAWLAAVVLTVAIVIVLCVVYRGREPMDDKPFVKRLFPIDPPDLPADLAEFYARHEGVGLESSPDRVVRFCRLAEVTRIGWRDLRDWGADNCPAGWEGFVAYRIGISSFFDEIVYVLNAPCCQPGAILTLGIDVGGPGGSGPAALEGSLVLAADFSEWLQHMERMGWEEYGLAGLDQLSPQQQTELRRYYKQLNPHITWGSAEGP